MTVLFVYLAIAIGVSFICSILEAVLLSMTPSFAEALNTDKPRAGAVVAKVRNSLDKSLSAILILNTFAHTIGAAGVGSQALQVFGQQWESLIAVLLTLAILYFSEIIPKTLGASYWRTLAVPAAWVILALVRIVYPLVWVATKLTNLFSRKIDDEVTRDEIIAMASLGHKDGNLFDEESQYLLNLLKLREVATQAVLTPRTVVQMLSKKTTVSEALSDENNRRFSRLPVYGDSVDDITTLVMLKDLYEALRQGEGGTAVEQLAKSLDVVSEKLPVHRLLDMFIKGRAHMYLVQDNFGQTSGIVTLEDAIETLLGREILDESDSVADMQALARDRFRARLRDKRAQP
ncbi:CNNM domain-containing protein [bacterium]|nr:CNNM domain-containing protein [bacterium]